MSRIVGRDDTHLKLRDLSEGAQYTYFSSDPGYVIVEHLDCDEEGNDLYTYDVLERHVAHRSGISAEQVNEYFEDLLASETWFCEADFFGHPTIWNLEEVMCALDDYKREHLDVDKDTILEMYWDGDIPEAPEAEV